MKKREMALAIQHIVDEGEGSELERVAEAYGIVTQMFIDNSTKSMELARAMGDEETAVKERIKANVMASAREIFAHCYLSISGERSEVWDE